MTRVFIPSVLNSSRYSSTVWNETSLCFKCSIKFPWWDGSFQRFCLRPMTFSVVRMSRFQQLSSTVLKIRSRKSFLYNILKIYLSISEGWPWEQLGRTHSICCHADRLWVLCSSQPVVGYCGEPWEVLFIWLYSTCVECKVGVERVSVREQAFNCGNASKPTFETTSLDLRSNSIRCIVFSE